MKLLIADDEQLMRQGIMKKIQMSGLPITSVFEAGDGAEALRMLHEVKPDIVITDIRMPLMDGLTFLKEAAQAMPELQFIVISGYGEFDYARKAIQFGVTDYLLKPVDKEELKESLLRVIGKIRQRLEQSEAGEQIKHLQSSAEESIRERMLSKLIQYGPGGVPQAERDEQLLALRRSCSYFVAVVFVLQAVKLPHLSFRQGDEKLLSFAVQNMISTVLESTERKGVLFRHAMLENELVYVLGGHSPVETDTLHRELEEILGGIQRHLKLEATIGCGGAVNQMEMIQQSYQQAKQALRNCIIHGNGRIYMNDAGEQVKAGLHSVISREDEALLLRFLSECNVAALTGWIDERVETIAAGKQVSFAHLESFCVEFHLLLRKYLLTQTSIPEWIIGELDDLLTWLHNLTQWRDMQGHLSEMIHNIAGHLYKLRHSSEYSVIDEVKLYIDSSLHEPINLQTIADRFYFHPSYFSRRFKERFGESFVNYLTAARLRKSEQFLRDSNLKIQEIAELVGFKDAAYFSSVFRKSTGMTPVQFRATVSSKI
ncbi:response regulator [Paenibacillus sp. BC26]|uniref:response regulator n=1 Tax=Paenibacillus sp. BC26 TaxID=1881032 RepID=UPI0008F173F3|nr:response regulator [Paenibacillus sp. BC26]SFT04223.1 two-component system, response regulator YesN [Paenibacillus sp. BC26]